MSLPRATLRLQFHASFTFDDAHARLDDWAALGISHLYASPVCAAVPGSPHGYDQTDPTRINPELGGEDGLRRLCAGLAARGMGLVLDIVPNHMATGEHNAWWMDVLRFGEASRHAHWFDIDWQSPDPLLRGRLLLPVLGRQVGAVVAAGELALKLDAATGELFVGYFDNRFPVGFGSYGALLRSVPGAPHLTTRLAALADAFDDAADLADDDAPLGIAHAQHELALERAEDAGLPSQGADAFLPARGAGTRGMAAASGAAPRTAARGLDPAWADDPLPARVAAAFDAARRALADALVDEELRATVERGLAAWGGPDGSPQKRAAWMDLLDAQPWRLAWWRTAADEINWRRFFDVNTLVALSMERPEVFDAVHALPLRLVREGLIDGLRIDHIDGLTDPAAYCKRLRAALDAAEQARDEARTQAVEARAELGMAQADAAHPASGVAALASSDVRVAERPGGRGQGRTWLVVEKILAPGEPMPDWPVDGTSGYDFMSEVAALLHAPEGEAPLTRLWRDIAGRPEFAEEKRGARAEILDLSFAAQFAGTVGALHRHARGRDESRDWSAHAITRALRALLLHFPVYRVYSRVGEASRQDRAVLAQAAAAARAELRPSEHAMLETLAGWLAGDDAGAAAPADGDPPPRREDRTAPAARTATGLTSATRASRAAWAPDDERLPSTHRAGEHADARAPLAEALRRFQQLSAPLAAKAIEDTALYRFGRLLSRNDVGFEPEEFALGPDDFHHAMQARAERWPHAMLTTATHDHKRGEDVRARLAMLSEVPNDWKTAVGRWRGMNRHLKGGFATNGGNRPADSTATGLVPASQAADAPSAGDEYMLYQTLVGAWPPGLAADDRVGLQAFAERVVRWQEKALREAKLRTGWIAPVPAYEDACRDFALALLDPDISAAFLADLTAFITSVVPGGVINSLVQLTLRCTCPGVPDLYQGADGWDFSLVDPDNRRPVDWDARAAMLGAAGLAHWPDPSIKQRLLRDLLALRAKLPDVFAEGGYVPVQIDGPAATQALAFIRGVPGRAVLVAVALRPSRAVPPNSSWLRLTSAFAGMRWRRALPGAMATVQGAAPREVAMSGSALPAIDRLLCELPVAVLEGGMS
ncbi:MULTISPECIES: malto-oligosyltrehalose synthase [Derxia]|uniref:Malto-oligosyltrehalose synthase n=1 Tax=Derxia gummosa DSM 723 TaxID=1121388 RepID=A0A9U5FXQ8_9BURK|nr:MULTISPECIES: malto-oligosyltrehalose synthase [Derxia]